MNIRPASFRDLGRIEQLHRESAARDALAGTDSPVPQTTLVRLWYALSKTLSSFVPTADTDALLVAEDDGEAVGFIQAQAVPAQPKTWQILNLCLATGRGRFAGELLLTQLCRQGSEHGVSRFSVRVPTEHSLLSLFLEQGFTQYATEQILFHDLLEGGAAQILTRGDAGAMPRLTVAGRPGASAGGDASLAIAGSGESSLFRVARRDDIGALHLLYLRTTPSHVANVEGPSLKMWQAAFHQGMLAKLGKDDARHLVAERPGVVAWAAVRPATPTQPTQLALMCEGQDAEFREEFIDAILAQIPAGPISCVLRHYDSELIRSLQCHGFSIAGSQLVLIRDLAVRVPVRTKGRRRKEKPVLVHAGLARSSARLAVVPTAPSSTTERHTQR